MRVLRKLSDFVGVHGNPFCPSCTASFALFMPQFISLLRQATNTLGHRIVRHGSQP